MQCVDDNIEPFDDFFSDTRIGQSILVSDIEHTD